MDDSAYLNDFRAATAVFAPETLVRHEAGHAVAVWHCGGTVQRIVMARWSDGSQGCTYPSRLRNPDHYLVVLSAGPLALFAHERPDAATFDEYRDWLSRNRWATGLFQSS